MDSLTSDDEVSDRMASPLDPCFGDEKSMLDDNEADYDNAWRTARVDITTDRKSDHATADTIYKDHHSNPFIEHEILQPKSSAPVSLPSPSSDERGWSTGADSSSLLSNDSSLDQDGNKVQEHESQSRYSEEDNEEIQLGYPKLSKKDNQENKIRDEWGFTSMDSDGGQLFDQISFDDKEDGSEWLSDAEKVATSGGTDGKAPDDDDDGSSQILPSLEKLLEEESSLWPSQIPQSKSTSNSRSGSGSKVREIKSTSRRHRQRGPKKSSNCTLTRSAKICSDVSNSDNSESIEEQNSRSQSNTPRSRPSYSSPRNDSKTKQRDRISGSDRNKMSRKLSLSSHQSKSVKISRNHPGGSKKAKEKFENKIGASPKNHKFWRKPTRPIKGVQAKNEGSQKLLSGNEVERYHGARNSVQTSFNPKDRALNALDFSNSISILNSYDCGLKTKSKRIHATINNEGYNSLVRKAYHKLLEARPRLKYLLSLSEWLHVHMLLLYARLFDCELHFYSIVLPREFQIAIPNKIMVFEPIAAVISSIGIVEDVAMGVTYIPVARSYRGNDIYKPHDKDDVTEFLEWTQYDWNSSWYQVEKARFERTKMAEEKKMKVPKAEAQFNDAKLEEWQQLAVEKWLGWDDDLWFSYNQACYVLSRSRNFVSIPRDSSKLGSYAWLLPRHNDAAGAFVRIPRPNLSPDCWMIAVMLDMCALEPATTATWYYETNSVDNIQYLIDCFLGGAIATTQSACEKC